MVKEKMTTKLLGFGARLPPDGQISHAFFVNGHPTNPYCEKIDGKAACFVPN